MKFLDSVKSAFPCKPEQILEQVDLRDSYGKDVECKMLKSGYFPSEWSHAYKVPKDSSGKDPVFFLTESK